MRKSLRAIPTVFKAVSNLFASTNSPSISPISDGAFFISWNRAIIVFIAVPRFSDASRVVSIIWVRNEAVFSKEAPAE